MATRLSSVGPLPLWAQVLFCSMTLQFGNGHVPLKDQVMPAQAYAYKLPP